MLPIIIIILLLLVMLIITNSLAQLPAMMDAKRIYKKLPQTKFYKLYDLVESDGYICWRTTSNSIQLTRDSYLFDGILKYCNPYLWYWHNKYTKWFKANIDLNTLPSRY